jgi:hypothetical protein
VPSVVQIQGISLSYNGLVLVCGDNFGFLILFDSLTGERIREIPAKLYGGREKFLCSFRFLSIVGVCFVCFSF